MKFSDRAYNELPSRFAFAAQIKATLLPQLPAIL